MIAKGLLALVFGLIFGTSTISTQKESIFTDALKGARLPVEQVRFDQDTLKQLFQDQFENPFFAACLNQPLDIPFRVNTLHHTITAQAESPAALVEAGARALGVGTRRGLIRDPLSELEEKSKQPNALQNAVLEIYKQAGVPMPDALQKRMNEELKNCPPFIKQQAALVTLTAIHAKAWRNAALEPISDQTQLFRLLTQSVAEQGNQKSDGSPEDPFWKVYEAMRKVDMRRLMAAGYDVTLSANRVANRLRNASAEEKQSFAKVFNVGIDTPWGRIKLSGNGDDNHPRMPYLLIIDTGGDDRYLGGAATLSVANSVSVLIDLEGNDVYLSPGTLDKSVAEFADRSKGTSLAFAGAVLGYAVLIDVAGNDIYRATSAGLGAARFGTAVLYDMDGDDLYDGYRFNQGAAEFGVGLLVDGGGKDRYYTFNAGQGYGGVMGFGLLLDIKGDDQYMANNTQLDFPSPQSQSHNANLAQGVGNGRRADYLDGHSLAGGIGMLVDREGDDRYECGVFGQGAGYWGGIGILVDSQGKDEYHGAWYVQGAAAHRAIGFLEDRAGNDVYRATLNMAQGAGHDFSVGFLHEWLGDDDYSAPNLGLGAGNANGIGIFLEVAGNDRYQAPDQAISLGRASPSEQNTLRERALCLGLFIDLAGNDTYPAAYRNVGNNRSWLNWARQNENPAESQFGAGLDK